MSRPLAFASHGSVPLLARSAGPSRRVAIVSNAGVDAQVCQQCNAVFGQDEVESSRFVQPGNPISAPCESPHSKAIQFAGGIAGGNIAVRNTKACGQAQHVAKETGRTLVGRFTRIARDHKNRLTLCPVSNTVADYNSRLLSGRKRGCNHRQSPASGRICVAANGRAGLCHG